MEWPSKASWGDPVRPLDCVLVAMTDDLRAAVRVASVGTVSMRLIFGV
jgi:hypothetical protein